MSVLIFMAGLSTVPKDMVEAATLEGAKKWQIWLYVIIPALRPIIEFVDGHHDDRRADLDVRPDLRADGGRTGHRHDRAGIS